MGRVKETSWAFCVAAALGYVLGCRPAEPPRTTMAATSTMGAKSTYPLIPDVMSCEAAMERYVEEYRGGGKGPADLTAGAYGAVLNRGRYLNAFGVPSSMQVQICAAIQNGRTVGVTVSTLPPNPETASCVDRQVRALQFPSHPRLDVARTSFAPACGASVLLPVDPTLAGSSHPDSGIPPSFVYVAKLHAMHFAITCAIHEDSTLDESQLLDAAYRGMRDAIRGQTVHTSEADGSKSAAVRAPSGHITELRAYVLPGGKTFSLAISPTEALPPHTVEEFLGSLQILQ